MLICAMPEAQAPRPWLFGFRAEVARAKGFGLRVRDLKGLDVQGPGIKEFKVEAWNSESS